MNIELKIMKYLNEGCVYPIPEIEVLELFFDYTSDFEDPFWQKGSSKWMNKVENELLAIVGKIGQELLKKVNQKGLSRWEAETALKRMLTAWGKGNKKTKVEKAFQMLVKDKKSFFYENLISALVDTIPF